MKRRRGFFLLEVSCFGFLFLCSILPYLSFQRDVFLFIQKDQEKLRKEITLQNAQMYLVQNLEEIEKEGKLYYDVKEGWRKESPKSIYETKIFRTTLKGREEEKNIIYFQIYDKKEQTLIWEGWRLERK